MERQLKERLIGAAVLVAVAVVMVPEMFSGPGESLTPEADSTKPVTNQIKTYSVELQSAQPEAESQPTVEPPAELPLDEARALQANPESSEAAPPDEQKPRATLTQTPNDAAAAMAVPDSFGSVKAAPKPETVKPASTATTGKSATGGWMVQVGSFSAQETAEQIAAKLKRQGYPAFVGSVKVKGKTLHRVRVGAMADRAAADATLQKLRGSYPDASVVAPGR